MGESARGFEGSLHVDDLDAGERGGRCAGSERVEFVFARFGVVARFDRRRRAAEEDDAVFETGAHHRDVPSLIAGSLVALFVGAVVFFVDDDEAEILDRAEDRGAGSDDELHFSLAEIFPRRRPFSEAAPVVENGDFLGEAGAEPLDRLRRQRDLGDEEDRAFSLLERRRDRLQIDLRFAASRDAINQVGRKGILIESR